MRIIKTIIFCVCTAVYLSAAAQAKYTNHQQVNSSDHHRIPLIELSQNQNFEFRPQTPALDLPETGSVKNFPKVAAVHFLGNERGISFDTPAFEDGTIQACKNAGYDRTSCAQGTSPASFCPYNNAYFKDCCGAEYKYSKSNCSYPSTVSSESCGGKYRCYCDRALYPIESAAGCTSPKIPTNDACIENGKAYYSACVCPSSYDKTCTEQNQVGSGTGCNQNGTTKYTSCQCKPGYNLTCSGEGNSPAKPTDYCLLNGIKYYDNCNTCPNKCTVADADKVAGVSYEYEECSKKYCAIGCAINYQNWCKMPETDCATLGYTKSASMCSDGYLKCPYNDAAVFCEDKAGTQCEDIDGCVECQTFNLNTNSAVCTKCALLYKLSNGKCIMQELTPVPQCQYGWLNDTTCCTKAQSDSCKNNFTLCKCYRKQTDIF